MKKTFVALVSVVLILILVVAATVYFLNVHSPAKEARDFYLGVSFNGGTTAEAKLLIDKVKPYTNLFVVQSGPVSINETAMNEIVDYAVTSGLDVIVYFGFFNPNYPWQLPWLDYAKQQWGNHFLGVYLNDEPGGYIVDLNWTGYFTQLRIRNETDYYLHSPAVDLALNDSLPPDYAQAAAHFNDEVWFSLGVNELKNRSITAFTSDYALYWFDYLGGYDVVFTEFGSNSSLTQNVALDRGAARMQNKTWGAIITWTYDQPPYLADGSAVYEQMLDAYLAGAKYIVIFDYPQLPGNPYGVLTEAHFAALQQLWAVTESVKPDDNQHDDAVLVLPQNYGWGMRREDDRIWGVWGPDEKSPQIWNISRELLTKFDFRLDMVYDDSRFPVDGLYETVYFWNQTVY
ncbi:MAG: hypothetical protein ACQCN5_04550 [Candidatus Bathyarchaeia archaeon]